MALCQQLIGRWRGQSHTSRPGVRKVGGVWAPAWEQEGMMLKGFRSLSFGS